MTTLKEWERAAFDAQSLGERVADLRDSLAGDVSGEFASHLAAELQAASVALWKLADEFARLNPTA